jgi:putative FmdB family regulatory protein
MPVYEYECDVCGERFELHRHFGEPHTTPCPNGHESVHRVFSPPSIIFKGSGFYVTDHRRNGRASQSRSREKESAEPETQKTKTKDKEGASA